MSYPKLGLRKKESDNCKHAVLEYLDALYRFAMSLTRNPTDAEDLVQETCRRAIKPASRHPIESNPKVWLFTILRNAWIDEWRHRAKGPEFISLGKDHDDSGPLQQRLSDEQERPNDNGESNILAERTRAAIQRLPAVFCEVVILRYFEGFSYRQIATILACPVGTVMSRLNHARAELNNSINGKGTSQVLQRERRSG